MSVSNLDSALLFREVCQDAAIDEHGHLVAGLLGFAAAGAVRSLGDTALTSAFRMGPTLLTVPGSNGILPSREADVFSRWGVSVLLAQHRMRAAGKPGGNPFGRFAIVANLL